ncbi:MAG: DUF4340 domain-containing protein [Planctomycetaceae bacterium]|nr:DUF4340 domain-containing protein [Planctomycetaceae bacterium]
MNETPKTLTFLAVAAVAVLLAIVTRPTAPISGRADDRGQLLYPDFKDPLSVASLEIVEFDESTATLHPFKVQQVDYKGKTRWAIPSHDSYPADASRQVAEAATALVRMKILDTPSEAQGDQSEYGVVEPNQKSLKLGTTGVGAKVVMKDKEGKELLALVLGKEVPGQPGQRYVRKVGEDPIYTVEARTDKFTTKFENWIERNLLQVSSFDVKQLRIRDYAIKAVDSRLAIIQRGQMQLEHNDSGEPKWKITEDQRFTADPQSPTGGKWTPVKMAADEELNSTKLDDMMYALDDLKIVDVSRKPAGLSADLKMPGKLTVRGDAAADSLEEKGFFPAQLDENSPAELFSNEGEIRVGANTGVEYVLRFGDIAGRGSAKKADDKKSKNADKKKDAGGPGMNRYLFIMAEFNPALLAKPHLEPLPEPAKEPDKKPTADAKKPETKKPEAKKADVKKPEDKKNATQKEADKKALQAERDRVQKDNKRKQDEYDQKVADGKKRVAELNARFADWYYIISDDVFRKIHLGRDEIVKKKDKPKDQAKSAKGDHAGHQHDAPAGLEKLKAEGPAGAN